MPAKLELSPRQKAVVGQMAASAVRAMQPAKAHLIPFTQRMYPGYRVAPHHDLIARVLEEVSQTPGGDWVAITMPPRHGKSLLASQHFPAWHLGNHPNDEIIACSYSADLANSFSRKARNLLSDPRWPFPKIRTAGDLSRVEAWGIAGHRGGYVASGVGGGITGRGADILLIDDPVKNAEEAESQTYRDRAWDWFTSTALTRLMPGGRVILIGTRWHEDDLIGRALNHDGFHFRHLNLPALDDDDNALWPDQYPAERLKAIRAQIGSRAFNALYQQQPTGVEGSILKREWWGWYDHRPFEFDWVVQSWDTAFKKGQDNDFSACLTLGLVNGEVYGLDLWMDRVDFPELKRAAHAQYVKWRPDEIVVEDKGSGQSLIQELATPFPNPEPDRNMPYLMLPIVGFHPDGDKIARANAASPYVESGRVRLPPNTVWAERFVEDCAAFPYGAHDDDVDAFTQGMLRLAGRLDVDRPLDPAVAAYFSGMAGVPTWG
jgi:predicted phage terminase large subunit-like protein